MFTLKFALNVFALNSIAVEDINVDSLEVLWRNGLELFVQYLPNVLLAFITFFVGWWLVKVLLGLINKALHYRKLDQSLSTFLESVVGIGLKILLVVSVVSMLGVQVSSLVALIGAAGLAVGLALQGALSNFAGGVLILMFKPFKVGDYIEAQGHTGTVEKISVAATTMRTLDHKVVIIPNGKLSDGTIKNYFANGVVRLDLDFGIGYKDSIQAARKVLLDVAANYKEVQKTPAADVVVANLGDSSVDLRLRVWVAAKDYWRVRFALLEEVKLAFDQKGITIPYPTQELFVKVSK